MYQMRAYITVMCSTLYQTLPPSNWKTDTETESAPANNESIFGLWVFCISIFAARNSIPTAGCEQARARSRQFGVRARASTAHLAEPSQS